MAAVTVHLDTRGWTAAITELGKAAPRVAVRALNRSIVTGRTVMRKEVAMDTGLKQNTVSAAFRTERATATSLVARLSVSGKRIPLIEFGARGPEPSRGRGRGVSARLKTGRGRYPHAFIATMRSGHRGVFQRVPGAQRRGPKPHHSQLPIYELFGPSLPKVFTTYLPVGMRAATDALTKNLAHEFEFALAKVRS
jgi:hypothetical protein